jgi:tRNA-specific 2-thiouridylase
LKTVVLGMSGGVDSAVSGYLLKQQGYNVIAVFMVNWEEQENGVCTSESDYEDVKRVCNNLDIPYYSVNYSKEYYERVFEYFLKEYKEGRTPNPDVLCNREIKFGPFLDFAKKIGADFIATGHYAKVKKVNNQFLLYKSKDKSKDQSYFLNQLSQKQLSSVIFPLADIEKKEVRQIAERENLINAKKKDSTGICFIGKRNFKEFLKNYLPANPGNIQSVKGDIVGKHDGLMYYTLGQRRGLNIGGKADGTGERWFVLDKDLKNNILIVSQGEDDLLFSNGLFANNFNWIPEPPKEKTFNCFAKFRYRQPDQPVSVEVLDNTSIKVLFKEKQRAITPGQFVVLYDENERCLGGGTITSFWKD